MVDFDDTMMLPHTLNDNGIESSVLQNIPNNILIETNTDIVSKNEQYRVQTVFDSVESIIEHWDNFLDDLDNKNSSKWRVHLSDAERKRFTRLKRIISSFKKQIISDISQFDVIEGYETFYTSHNKSIAKLADIYIKRFNT